MRFTPLDLPGLVLIEVEPHADARGVFARTFCEDEFAQAGLVSRFVQSSASFNPKRGTVRGMHFARAPHAETKLVRCTAGAIYDVAIDLRQESPTYRQAFGLTLSAADRQSLYIPAGFAHGFQTLQDDTEVLYMIDTPYVPGASSGLRWNDPAVSVTWPDAVTAISPRDLAFPDWTPASLSMTRDRAG